MRVQKFLGTEAFVMEAPVAAHRVEVVEAYRQDPVTVYEPRTRTLDDRTYIEPVVVTNRGAIRFEVDSPVDFQLYVRHRGLLRHGFNRVRTVSGGIHGVRATEIRWLPERLESPWTLSMRDLHNVFNDYPVEDGDLVLAELTDEAGTRSSYLFRTRRLGWRFKAGAGVLFSVPLPDASTAWFSPLFAASLSTGYRFRTRAPTARWIGDNLALVASVGIGSTALEGEAVEGRQLDRVLNAGLVGGGVELYDIVSIQAFVNVSAIFREASERPSTLAVGFDAVQFGRVTRDATRRLFRRNVLESERTW